LSGALTSLVLTALKILPPAPHTPRVTFDRLVVSRETWNFSPSELAFARETDEAERFVAARRWMQAHGLPRLVFVKTPAEVKPFFVDFESPTFVNILAKMVRHCLPGAGPSPHRANLTEGRIIISEMLPTPEQTWLKDLDGVPCTSEFRFVALDLKSL
jgi:hypothetical protein